MNIQRWAYQWPTKLYDFIAPLYDRWMGIGFKLGKVGHKRVAEGLSQGMVLDAACGTGTLVVHVMRQGASGFGIDLSSGMIRQAARKGSKGKWIRGDYYRLPFPEGTFNYVVETNALGGVTVDLDHVLREMIRVCKVGGEIRIADYMRPVKFTFKARLIELLFAFTGDYAHDLRSHFNALGYTCDVETLGLSGMYQFMRIVRTH